MKKISILIGITMLAITMAVAAGCGQQSNADIDRSAIKISSSDTVTVGDIEWELLEAEDLGPSLTSPSGETYGSKEGKLVKIAFAATNMGDEIKQIFDMKLVDADGNYYSVCTEAYAYYTNPEVCTVQDVMPGTRMTFEATFDITSDASDLILEVTDLETPPVEKGYMDLGI